MSDSLSIIHHLHRTGGTLVGRCLGSLPGVTLLSEVNPRAPDTLEVLNPAFQAHFWQKLLPDQPARELALLPFQDQIEAIWKLASDRGDRLLLRDWSYIDFFARPFLEEATDRFSIVEALRQRYELRRIALVRHPLDQWLSWCNYQGAARADDCGLERFLEKVRLFSSAARDITTVRYEDFVREPEQTMKHLCEALELPFDPVFRRRWYYYHQITGDNHDRVRGAWKIEPRPRREVPEELIERAEANSNYRLLLRMWGYD